MKKLVLLVSALFVVGCGTGGTDTASNNGTNDGGNAGIPGNIGPVSMVTLNIVDKAAVTAKSVASAPTTGAEAPDQVRVVVRKSDTVNVPVYPTDEEGEPDYTATPTYRTEYKETFRYVRDYAYTVGTPVAVEIPEGTGYFIDVLTNRTGADSKHTMYKFGRNSGIDNAGVSIPATSLTVVVADLAEIIRIETPNNSALNPIVSDSGYSLKVTTALPLKSGYCKIRQDNGPVTFSSYSGGYLRSSGTYQLTAPKVYRPAGNTDTMDLHFHGLFYIDDSMLKSGEVFNKWTRIYPNTTFGETISQRLLPLISYSLP